MHLIPSQNFITQPWRNGGGITHEIARDRDGADFGWRISVADVASSGPFSLFPNHQRLLCVIAGNGMNLVREGRTYAALPLAPVSFTGSEIIDGQLIDGPCRDFNLMFDPKKFQGEINILRGSIVFSRSDRRQGVLGFYAIAGQATVNDVTLNREDFCLLEDRSDQFVADDSFVALQIVLQPV